MSKKNVEWEWKKLGEVCYTFDDGDWIESSNQSPCGIRLIQTGNIGCGIFKDKGEKARYISENTFKKLNCTEIFPGDCLISRLPNPLGRACILPDLESRMITAVDCTIVRFNNFFNSSFFLYYSQSTSYQAEIDAKATGTTRSRISRKNLAEISIPIPPLDEQERIVKVLDDAFKKIDAIKNTAETNLQNAKDLFQTTLANELSITDEKIKQGWYVKKIEDTCKRIFAGGDKPSQCYKEKNKNYSIPVYANAIENDGLYGFTDKAIVKEKCISISARGTIGFVCKREHPFVPIVRLIVAIPNEDIIDLDFFFFALRNLDIQGNGTSIPQLTVPFVKQYIISCPPLPIQKQIVAKLDSLSEKVKQLESNYKQVLADCDELKKALLKQAFEGML